VPNTVGTRNHYANSRAVSEKVHLSSLNFVFHPAFEKISVQIFVDAAMKVAIGALNSELTAARNFGEILLHPLVAAVSVMPTKIIPKDTLFGGENSVATFILYAAKIPFDFGEWRELRRVFTLVDIKSKTQPTFKIDHDAGHPTFAAHRKVEKFGPICRSFDPVHIIPTFRDLPA
jgi:hypothetical protein